jgi:DNA-binding MarR family transcriptional regulator
MSQAQPAIETVEVRARILRVVKANGRQPTTLGEIIGATLLSIDEVKRSVADLIAAGMVSAVAGEVVEGQDQTSLEVVGVVAASKFSPR